MKLIGYVRVSSEEQRDNSSLSDQKKKIADYCSAMSYELLEIFEDVQSGKSAKNRAELQKALIMVQSQADGLIVAKLDRLGRNTRDILELVEDELEPSHKTLVLLDLNLDTSTPSGKMMLTVMASMSEFERKRIKERVTDGRAAKKEANGYIGGAPQFGLKAKKEDKELVIDEDEQKVIEIIRKHHKSGKSLAAIAKFLNSQNIPTKRGKEWQPMVIKRIIDRMYPNKNKLPKVG